MCLQPLEAHPYTAQQVAHFVFCSRRHRLPSSCPGNGCPLSRPGLPPGAGCPRPGGSAVYGSLRPHCDPLWHWAWAAHGSPHQPARREPDAPVPAVLRARHGNRPGEDRTRTISAPVRWRRGHRLLLHRKCPNDFCRPRGAYRVRAPGAGWPVSAKVRGPGLAHVPRCECKQPAADHF
jgi:hypothetical protein